MASRPLAAGTALMVVAMMTAVSAVAETAASRPAIAATGTPVLVLLQGGETTAPEAAVLQAAGYSVTQVTPSQWENMSTASFGAYAALVIGDPSSGSCSGLLPTTGTSGPDALGTAWQAAVTGDIAVLGTAPALPDTTGANALIADAVGYAAAGYSSAGSTGTGLYESLNCEYSTTSANTGVPLLAGVEGIGAAGGLTVQGGLSCTDAGTINKWEADAAATFNGLSSGSLSTGANGFPSPACPIQEAFDSWPANFTPLAYDAASDATANFTASDGATGQPYLLLGTPPLTSSTQIGEQTLALAPAADGDVPAGTTQGGSGNAAAAGVSQPTAGDTVNTENGDLTQSDTDVSIPTFGPSLDYTRTYDAKAAAEEMQAGAPGQMGYGWTDSWASSVATEQAVPGDIYTADGLATDTGMAGPAVHAAIGRPQRVYINGGNTYIADSAGNRILEVPAASQTQWGITMTAGDVYTIAGSPTGASGSTASGTPASSSKLNSPSGVAMDDAGDLFIANTGDNDVLEIAASAQPWGEGYDNIPSTATADDVYIVAGTGQAGVGKDSEAASSSDLRQPASVFIGGNAGGNLYIADTGNNRIQMVPGVSQTKWGQSMSAYDVYTVSGSSGGTPGSSGDGGPATSALLRAPQDVTVSPVGDIYIADTANCRIQEEPKASGTEWGNGNSASFTANDLYTIAGQTGNCGTGADGQEATSSDLDYPSGVAAASGVDGLYIADTDSNRVQEVASATGTQYGQSMTIGDVYTIAGSSSGGSGVAGNGGPASSALLSHPDSVANDGSRDVYVADASNDEVREVSGASPFDITDAAGNGLSLATAGNGGSATTAALSEPEGEAFDSAGDVYVADTNNCRVQEIAAASHSQWGIAMTAGDVYTVAGQQDGNCGDWGDGGLARGGGLNEPEAVALDASGDLFIADEGNNRIQEVAAASGTQWGQSMTAGDIYTVAGSQTGVSGDAGDGASASSSLLYGPSSVTIDKAGDIYIADSANNRVQEMYAPGGEAWGHTGWVVGDIYTIAGPATGGSADAGTSGDGGPATSALLSLPLGVAVDSAGNVYIADWLNNRVQEVPAVGGSQFGQSMKTGDMYTIAGSAAGEQGLSGDGGPATGALLDGPASLAVDLAGDVYIADSENNRVQEVPAVSGVQWGQQMTAADMYTVAGSSAGTAGESGDGGPGTVARMNLPDGVSVDPSGDLYITDSGNHLREDVATSSQAIPVSPHGAAITITQPGGSQVTFTPKTSGSCTAPLVAAGGFCVQPVFQGATLTSNTTSQTYTFSPSLGADSYVYSWGGQLLSETDTAGDALTITYLSPAPGSAVTGFPRQICPSTATSCETITSASGRALVIGSNSSGLVTSVTDPMGRQWTYGYNGSSQLISATDPMGNETTYTYGAGSTGDRLLASDLLTITEPNAQPGGPDAGDATVNVYNGADQVTSQTDPAGWKTTFNYCVNAAVDDCMDSATGNGFVSVTDPDGNTAVYDYDQATLAAQTNWTGASLTSEHDYVPDTTAGNPNGGTLLDTVTADGNGDITTEVFNNSGEPTSVTSPDGVGSQLGTTTAAYSSLGEPDCSGSATESSSTTCAQDPGPAPVAPGAAITPPSSVPPVGLTYSQYDTDGNELSSTTGVYAPGSTTAAYSQTTYQLFKGNSVTLNGTNISCTVQPPSPSLPCAEIDADGAVTQLTYDDYGDLTSSATADGNGSQLSTTTDSYDTDGEQISEVAPDGNVAGANAGNYTTTTSYDADGDQTAITAGDGSGSTVSPRTISYGYDADGNQTSTTDSRGYTTTVTYNADDNAVLTTNELGDQSLTCYDGDGNAAQTVPPVGVAANNLTPASCPTAYPAGYNPATSMLASDATMTTFDADGNQTEVYSPAPAGQVGFETTSYTYDGNRNRLTTKAPSASDGGQVQETVDSYNAANELASETTGYGTAAASTTSYCYDPNGDQTSVVMPDGNTSGVAPCETAYPWVVNSTSYSTQASYQTTTSYDSVDELVRSTSPATAAAPSGATTTATFDPDGNQLTSTDPDGVTTTWTYEPTGNVASISYSGSSAHSISYGYDANGNTTTMADGTGTSSYTYDPFGELTSATNGAGQTVSYQYDLDGNNTGITYPLPSSATWPSTHTVQYGYDAADQLTSVTDFNNDQTAVTPNADGLPSSETLGSTGDTIAVSYDNTDSPSAVALKNGTSTLQSFSYADAPAGNILSETDTPASANSPATYAYDAQDRVTSMTAGTNSAQPYSYDASGNLTTLPNGATGSYDHGSELTSATLSGTSTSYTYNADGERLTSKKGSTTTTSGTWNGADELTAYTSSAGDMSAASYDGNGMRTSATITPSSGSAVTEGYVWNDDNLLMDSTNAYIYGGGTAPIEQVNLSTGAISYLNTDSLGSVRGVVSSAGALTASTSYNAWGSPQTAGGLTAYTPFGYAGGYTDPDGLIYLVNRYYDPATGQFTSVDPDVSETLAPYAYAGSNPVSNSDPTGDYETSETSHFRQRTGVSISEQLCAGVNVWVISANGCVSGTFNQTVPAGSMTATIDYNKSGSGTILGTQFASFHLRHGVPDPFFTWFFYKAGSGKREFRMHSKVFWRRSVKSWWAAGCAAGKSIPRESTKWPDGECTKYRHVTAHLEVDTRLWAVGTTPALHGKFYPAHDVGFVINNNGH